MIDARGLAMPCVKRARPLWVKTPRRRNMTGTSGLPPIADDLGQGSKRRVRAINGRYTSLFRMRHPRRELTFADMGEQIDQTVLPSLFVGLKRPSA